MNITDFKKGTPISMVTCYDYTFAKALNESGVDTVLVGDSVAMVVYGESSTTYATPKMIERHVRAVRKGYDGFIVADLPFISLQKSKTNLMKDVKRIINAGASAIKIEGLTGNEKNIKRIIKAGVPVIGHIGLTPQFVNSMGGFKVQGRDDQQRAFILKEAVGFEKIGAKMVVIECIPEDLTRQIVKKLSISTVGIGAGGATDGQVLVLQDLLGLTKKKFKFVKKYKDFYEASIEAVKEFKSDIDQKSFPKEEHVFS